MNFSKALELINGSVDCFYEEYGDTPEYKEIEKAETVFTLLIKKLADKNINTLADLEEKLK